MSGTRVVGLVVTLTLLVCGASVVEVHSQQSATAQQALGKLPPALAARTDDVPARVLVKIAAPFTPEGRLASRAAASAQRSAIDAAQASLSAAFAAAGASRARPFRTIPWVAVEATPAVLRALAARGDVVSIEEDRLMRPALLQSVPLVHAPLRWQGGLDGAGWTVAVLDSGVARDHEFLAGKLAGEACFSSTGATSTSLCPGGAHETTGSGAGRNCDPHLAGCGHGTHVAGIAVGRNHQGMGVAPGARFMSVQIFSRFDDAGTCGGASPCILSYVSDQVRALEHVFLSAGPGNAARIAAVNLSVAGQALSTTCDGLYASLKNAVDQLASIGIATVVAAGNDGRADAVGSPACVSSAIAVGATTKDDRLASFSNRAAFLDLLAPGDSIVSSVPSSYTAMSGTSMAAPHVAGAWAIAKQQSPAAGVDQLLAVLQGMARQVVDPATGRRYARLDLAGGTSPDAPESPGRPSGTVNGSRVTVQWTPPVTGTADRYVITAGTSPGGRALGTFDVGPTTAVAAELAPGTYFVRVAAVFGTAMSPESPELNFTIGAAPVPPAPLALSATVSGPHVTLAWTPPAGAAVHGYVLAVGSAPGLANLVAAPTGSAGTSLQAVAPPGTYYVRVHAQTAGGVSGPSNEVVVVVR
jgi:subtilisin family serine protease